ncbi:pseudouridine synthase [Fibrella aestuarina BUZ 2]|uniref:Pseudouridine synthase n=1 Tax=Fibrella aestuarina BUZ 2 TaxID=1166018 RepID=I0K4E8_9BACT|nr:RluA family pseudouridine synthase [Fibrella aestuarina]CCG99001.1 pseudouridine synthase [Fibrella aestuarina BUZ 2]
MKKRLPYSVVYEDNHLLIVNKEPGVLVQSDRTGDPSLTELLKEYVKEKYNKPGDVFLNPIHRLDRPVSGLVVFGRTSKATERMAEIFRKRQVQKTYWAVVRQHPAEKKGKLVHYLVKDEAKNQVTTYDYEVPGSQRAELSYRLLGKINEHYLLEVEPLTGRPHQIRAQLAAMGCPIRGDVKYGYDRPVPEKKIYLHARRLYFIHPVKKEPLILRAGLPDDGFWEEFLELDNEEFKDKNLDFIF